jgi:hypothetical protein
MSHTHRADCGWCMGCTACHTRGEGGWVVSVTELHWSMAHIAPASMHKLVEGGLVTRIVLDPNSWDEHCKAHTIVSLGNLSPSSRSVNPSVSVMRFIPMCGGQSQWPLNVADAILSPSESLTKQHNLCSPFSLLRLMHSWPTFR